MAIKTSKPTLRVPSAPKKKSLKVRRPPVMTSKKNLEFLPRTPGAPLKKRQQKLRGDACSDVKKCLLWDLVFSQYSATRDNTTPARDQVSPVHVGAPVKVKVTGAETAVNSKRKLQF